MTQQHPINPSSEQVQQWIDQSSRAINRYRSIATLAAQWGADRQLEADAEWLDQYSLDVSHLTIIPTGKGLVEAMRPKPPSLKEQALAAAAELEGFKGVDTIRRALEALPDD